MLYPQRPLPRGMRGLLDLKRVGAVSLVTLGFLVFVLSDLQNGWSAFLPAILGPLLMSLLMAWNPLVFFSPMVRDNLATREQGPADQGAALFRASLQSSRAKRVLLLTGISTSAALFLLMWVIVRLQSKPVSWIFSPRAVLPLIFLLGLWSMGLHYHFLLRWAVRTGSARVE